VGGETREKSKEEILTAQVPVRKRGYVSSSNGIVKEALLKAGIDAPKRETPQRGDPFVKEGGQGRLPGKKQQVGKEGDRDSGLKGR